MFRLRRGSGTNPVMATPGLPQAVRQPRVHSGCQPCMPKKTYTGVKRLHIDPFFLRRKEVTIADLIFLVLNTHPTGRPPCQPFLPAQVEQVKLSTVVKIEQAGKRYLSIYQLLLFLLSLTTASSDFWPSSPLMLEKWLLLPPLGSSPAESPESPANHRRASLVIALSSMDAQLAGS